MKTTCTMQTVEQNAIINKIFISLYQQAKQYMSEPLAEQFTQDFCSEVKPTLIKLTQQQAQQAASRPFRVGDLVNITEAAKAEGIETPKNPCLLTGRSVTGRWKAADGRYADKHYDDPQCWAVSEKYLTHAD